MPLHQLFKGFPVGPSGDRQVAFFRRAYAEIPALAAELKRNNLVNLFFATGYPVAFFGTKPLANLDGIKGDKWRTASFWHRDFLRNAGAIPVSMPWNVGIFNALRAGTLDGLMVNIDSGYMLKVHEAAPHVVASKELWLGHVYLLAMNGDSWDRLASEDKDAIRRAAETAHRASGAVMDESFDAMVRDLAQEGVKVRILTGPEVAAFEQAAKTQDVQAAWVKEQQGKGIEDVAAVREKVAALVKAATQQSSSTKGP